MFLCRMCLCALVCVCHFCCSRHAKTHVESEQKNSSSKFNNGKAVCGQKEVKQKVREREREREARGEGRYCGLYWLHQLSLQLLLSKTLEAYDDSVGRREGGREGKKSSQLDGDMSFRQERGRGGRGGRYERNPTLIGSTVSLSLLQTVSVADGSSGIYSHCTAPLTHSLTHLHSSYV